MSYCIDDSFNLSHTQHIWELAFRPWRFNQLDGIAIHDSFEPEVLAEAPHAAEHACLAVPGQSPVVQMTKEALDVLKFDAHGCFDLLFVRGKLHELFDVTHVCHHRVFAQTSLEGEVVVIALYG